MSAEFETGLTFEEALREALGTEEGITVIHIGQPCPECGDPLALTAGPAAATHVALLLRRYPHLDMDPGPGWLDGGRHRAYVYCEREACPVGAPLEFTAEGVSSP